MLSTVSALACYIFDIYQPILLIILVDSKAVVLYSVQILLFTWPFLCNTSSSTGSMLLAVRILRHLLLPEPPSNP